MDRNIPSSQGYRLESQIREAFGKVMYTTTCHDKIIARFIRYNSIIKVSQIILSAITTSGFVVAIWHDSQFANLLGAFVSLALLILNTYAKNIDLVAAAQEHKIASDQLWKIREEYVSLLTDFEMLSSENIMKIRDELQNRTHKVYCTSPRTDARSYRLAQKALKTDEEQTFSDEEIDIMLPGAIRRCNRSINKEESR